MLKKLVVGLALLGSFGIAGVASAAVNLQDFEFTVNNQFSDEIRAGDDVDVGFSFDVSDGDEVEFARVRFYNSNGDIVESACRGIGRISDANDREVEVNIDTKSDITEGMLDIKVALFGMPGVDQSNNCDLVNLLDEEPYNNRLFVQEGTGDSNDDNDDDNSTGSGSNDDNNNNSGTGSSANAQLIASMQAQINTLMSQIAAFIAAASAPAPTHCAPVGASTVQLQSYFVSRGYMTQAEMNTGPGIFGPKTTRANAAYHTANPNCP